MILDLPRLLAPIDGKDPCGSDLRTDPRHGDLYYRMKDARNAARAAERASDAELEPASRPAEWRTLIDLTQDALATCTKDLEIAAWLTEAALRLHGFAGLHDGFVLIEALVERYWEGLFSVDVETLADKVGPLAGLNGIGQEGTLIQPIRLSPLTTPVDGAGLWTLLAARRGGAGAVEAQRVVDAAVRTTDTPTFVAIAADLRGAITAFDGLMARLDQLCGVDAPPSGNIRTVLAEALSMLVEVAGPVVDGATGLDDGRMPEAGPSGRAALDDAAPVSTTLRPIESSQILDRNEALRQLSRIAAFFQSSEPNAPTGYVLETLVRRARMPVADLVAELIPDETARQAFLSAAGIGRPRQDAG